MATIDKKHLEHLAKLARISLSEFEEKKFLEDLRKIIDYFSELEMVNTQNVASMAGGTELKNVLRPDEITKARLRGDKAVDAFPEKEGGFLKIPPVFSAEGGSLPAGRQGASGGE